MPPYFHIITLLVVFTRQGSGVPPSHPSTAAQLNSTASLRDENTFNATNSLVGSRISTILRDLPTIKNLVVFLCVLTTLLITCLVIKAYRSGKKIRKTRKYDIITTPAERVEMAPLNEENDDDDDSTLFDVKYR
ncbi:membrane protein FAM174B [Brachyhypopomus gauderio]|uniref:membrane protein FAM174B n=1 Tax=Brachyhypopomus gauderio TaxID=698409 RepID=UPI0040429BA3